MGPIFFFQLETFKHVRILTRMIKYDGKGGNHFFREKRIFFSVITGGVFLSGSEERSFTSQKGEMGIKYQQGESAILTGIRQALWVQMEVDGVNARLMQAFPHYLFFTSEM